MHACTHTHTRARAQIFKECDWDAHTYRQFKSVLFRQEGNNVILKGKPV